MQPPKCYECQLEAAPESVQHKIFLATEILLLFINWKFAIIAVFVGYLLSSIHWYCPFCKANVSFQSRKYDDMMIIRAGNCMLMFSKIKFLIIAVLVSSSLIYLQYSTKKYVPTHAIIERDWKNLVLNCGYREYMENSVRASAIYHKYSDTGKDWVMDGMFLGYRKAGSLIKLLIKANPTQFEEFEAHDFLAFMKLSKQPLDSWNKYEMYRFYGEWDGQQQGTKLFEVDRWEPLNREGKPEEFKYIYQSKGLSRN